MRRTSTAAVVALAVMLTTILTLVVSTASPSAAIIGGHPSPAPYSFMGSLQRLDAPRDDLHACGVSLVAPRWAITAGHCTRSAADVIDEPTSGHPRGWKVRFGSTRVGSGGDLVRVEQFVQLNNRYFVRDLALLRLARPVQAEPVAIAATSPAPGTDVRILGWGQTCDDPVDVSCSPERLQEADTKIQPPRTCRAPEGTLCVGPLDGRVGPSNMDSGGPALVLDDGRWTLVGSVEGAGYREPSVYTDVVEYAGWVRRHVSGDVPIPPDTPFLSAALRGTATIGGCSGVVLRSPRSRLPDPAMLLTNGHCAQPRPRPGEAVTGRPQRAPVLIRDAHGDTVVRAYTSRLLYATMTGTDLAVYRLDRSYAELRRDGIVARALAAAGPRRGEDVRVLSATSGQDWTCTTARVVGLLEGGYAQEDAIRYRTERGCSTRLGDGPGHGDSGSPLVDPRTGRIVGLHSTGNDEGLRCRPDNPCEVDADGTTTSVEGRRYGQQTSMLRNCLVAGSRVVTSRPRCTLT